MIRQSSIDAYHSILVDDSLSKMRMETFVGVFKALSIHGRPVTASEIAVHLRKSVGGRGSDGNVHARCGELVEWGVLIECLRRNDGFLEHAISALTCVDRGAARYEAARILENRYSRLTRVEREICENIVSDKALDPKHR